MNTAVNLTNWRLIGRIKASGGGRVSANLMDLVIKLDRFSISLDLVPEFLADPQLN